MKISEKNISVLYSMCDIEEWVPPYVTWYICADAHANASVVGDGRLRLIVKGELRRDVY